MSYPYWFWLLCTLIYVDFCGQEQYLVTLIKKGTKHCSCRRKNLWKWCCQLWFLSGFVGCHGRLFMEGSWCFQNLKGKYRLNEKFKTVKNEYFKAHLRDKNGSKRPAFWDKRIAKIPLGIKIVWKVMSEGCNILSCLSVSYHRGHILTFNLRLSQNTENSWSLSW